MKITEIIPDILEDDLSCIKTGHHIPVKDVARGLKVYLTNEDNIPIWQYPSKCVNCDKQFNLEDWPLKLD